MNILFARPERELSERRERGAKERRVQSGLHSKESRCTKFLNAAGLLQLPRNPASKHLMSPDEGGFVAFSLALHLVSRLSSSSDRVPCSGTSLADHGGVRDHAPAGEQGDSARYHLKRIVLSLPAPDPHVDAAQC